MVIALLLKPLSLRERGWGEGPVADSVPGRLDHGIGLKQYIVVPEAQHLVTVDLKKPCAGGIGFLRVLRPIEFDHQPGVTATEIRNAGWQRMLAAELHARQLPASEMAP